MISNRPGNGAVFIWSDCGVEIYCSDAMGNV